MNPIIDTWPKVFPGVAMTRAQERAATRGDDPAKIAAKLADHAAYIRKRLEGVVGPDIITDADVAARVPLDYYTSSLASMPDDWFFRAMPVMRGVEVGQASHFGMRGLYAKHIGAYDPIGAEFWESAFVAAAKRDGTLK